MSSSSAQRGEEGTEPRDRLIEDDPCGGTPPSSAGKAGEQARRAIWLFDLFEGREITYLISKSIYVRPLVSAV